MPWVLHSAAELGQPQRSPTNTGHNWALQWGEHRGDAAAGTPGKVMAQSQLPCAAFPHNWAIPAWHKAFGEPRLQCCIYPCLGLT